MLVGRISKAERRWWLAECDVIGAFTQGKSRKDACTMLADLIETMVGRPGFRAIVVEAESLGDSAFAVHIDANDSDLLLAEVLKNKRHRSRLSIAVAARRFGVTETTYARYERGTASPRIGKLAEFLGPDVLLTVQPKPERIAR